MEIEYKRLVGPEYVTGALRATSGQDMKIVKPVSIHTWEKLCKSAHGVPHSPLRAVLYRFYVTEIPSWVTVHYVRHHIGVQFYVKSQRDDRNPDEGIPRSEKPQGELINMMFDINANALISIAKARLCKCASEETQNIMKQVRIALSFGDSYDKMLSLFMTPSCEIYRKCFEPNPCAFGKGLQKQ